MRFRKKQGCKNKTINNSLAIVRRICNLAATEWRLDNGLTWLAVAPTITLLDLSDQRPPRPITWEEQRILMPKLPAHLARMVLFDINTGVRENVVCNLRWDWEVQVQIRSGLQASVFIVPRRYVKGRKQERIIVCNTVAQDIIDTQRGKHPERVFTYGKQKPRPVGSMNNTAWQTARKSAGLGDLHVHDLRHTVGMRLRDANVPDRTQDDILWHARGTMTGHYAVAQVREIYEALECISQPGRHEESLNLLALLRQAQERKVPVKSPQQRKTDQMHEHLIRLSA